MSKFSIFTESACARSCVHYYFSPIANFSKNQIFGSASSYGNSASSKNTSSELAEFAPELAEFAREFAGKVFCAS